MKDWRAHTGMDFSGAEGDEVKVAAAGTVKQIYTDDFYGATVVVGHGEWKPFMLDLTKFWSRKATRSRQSRKSAHLA